MKLKNHWPIIVFALAAGVVGGALSGWAFFMVDSSGAVSTDIEIAKLFLQAVSFALLAGSIYMSAYSVKKQLLVAQEQVITAQKQMVATQDWNKRKATRDMAVSCSENFHKHEHTLRTLPEAEVDFSSLEETYSTFEKMEKDVKFKIWNEILPILAEFERMAKWTTG